VPSSVSILRDSVFSECKKLPSVTFDTPSQLTNISNWLINGCWCLTTLTLPESVTTTIGHSALMHSGVSSIIGSDWTLSAGLVVGLGTLFCYQGRPSSLRIPATVREIGDRALSSLGSIVDLRFEEGTVQIGMSAFLWCRSLMKAAFPASLIVIEAKAFQGCICLQEITFAVGSQLQYIRSGAFSDCPLKEVVVPASIVEIDPSAFSDEVWRSCVKFDGSPLFLINSDCICSINSRVMFRSPGSE
jgi:hypothetical protein